MTDEERKEFEAAQAQIKAVFDEGIATINDRDYKFTVTSHAQRVKVFAFLTSVRPSMQRQDFSFLTTKEWADVEKVINNIVMFDDQLLSRRPTHWEEYPDDYITFITTALPVISYPFLRGKATA